MSQTPPTATTHEKSRKHNELDSNPSKNSNSKRHKTTTKSPSIFTETTVTTTGEILSDELCNDIVEFINEGWQLVADKRVTNNASSAAPSRPNMKNISSSDLDTAFSYFMLIASSMLDILVKIVNNNLAVQQFAKKKENPRKVSLYNPTNKEELCLIYSGVMQLKSM
jgi:hypothetical protein